MTEIIGFDADQDCSAVVDAFRSIGGGFIARYLKNLSQSEAQRILNAGLALLLIFETTAQRALSGAAGGLADGQKARDQAGALGAPQGVAIVATVDFDATEDQQPAVLAYLGGFKSGLAGQAKLTVYANGAICAAALDAGIADYAWLAGGSGMRGTRAFAASGRATIIQDVGDKRGLALGISIDSDVAYAADFGGWSLASVPQPAQPTPAAVPPLTRATIRAWQAMLGVAVDGDPGPLTAAAMRQYLNQQGD